jgi:hypothetical protein
MPQHQRHRSLALAPILRDCREFGGGGKCWKYTHPPLSRPRSLNTTPPRSHEARWQSRFQCDTSISVDDCELPLYRVLMLIPRLCDTAARSGLVFSWTATSLSIGDINRGRRWRPAWRGCILIVLLRDLQVPMRPNSTIRHGKNTTCVFYGNPIYSE